MCDNRALMLATGAAPGLGRKTALPWGRANSCVVGQSRNADLASRRRLVRLDASDVCNAPKRKARAAAGFPAGRRPAADWLLGAAFLPMIILAAAMAITAVAAPSGHPASSEPAASTTALAGNADGYVEALARIGVATLPCQSGICRKDVRVTDR